MVKIKLRSSFEGQDSWGAFVEEIGIDTETYRLVYRSSTGGNCNYGTYKQWQDESVALNHLLGPVLITDDLRAHLFVAISKLPDLEEGKLNQYNRLHDLIINYRAY